MSSLPSGVAADADKDEVTVYLVTNTATVRHAADSPTELDEDVGTARFEVVVSHREHYLRDSFQTGDVGTIFAEGSAKSPEDFVRPAAHIEMGSFSLDTDCNCYRAKKVARVPIEDDNLLEGDETFFLEISRVAGIHAFWIHDRVSRTITIKDNEELDLGVSLSSGGISEIAESSSVLTISTGGPEFESDQEFTLTIAGTATLTDDYTISPADADSMDDGHQVTLTAGETSVEVTFTAVKDDDDDKGETILVTVSQDGTNIGSQKQITITGGRYR